MPDLTGALAKCRWHHLFAALFVLQGAGCGGPKLVPVSGTVTLADQPLTGGRIIFYPDASKGNDARVACTGRISADGRYEIFTTNMLKGAASGKGAPPGWYKVTLVNSNRKDDLDPNVDAAFQDEEKTPLIVEVADPPTPGAFDFKLTNVKKAD